MARAAEQWLGYLENERRLAPSSIETYRSILTKSLRLLPLDFTEHEFRKAIEPRIGERASSHVRRATFVVLTQLLRWWEEHGGPDNWLAEMKAPPKPDVRRRALNSDELSLFAFNLMKADIKDRVECMLMLYQGFRVSDVTNLKVADIDFAGRRIRCRQGKGGTDSWLPMGPTVADALHGYLDLYVITEGWVFTGSHGRMSTQAVWGAWKRVCGPELNYLMPHQARHTFGSQLLRGDAHADLNSVRRLLRHRSIATTQLYLSSDSEAEQGAILALDRQLGQMGLSDA